MVESTKQARRTVEEHALGLILTAAVIALLGQSWFFGGIAAALVACVVLMFFRFAEARIALMICGLGGCLFVVGAALRGGGDLSVQLLVALVLLGEAISTYFFRPKQICSIESCTNPSRAVEETCFAHRKTHRKGAGVTGQVGRGA